MKKMNSNWYRLRWIILNRDKFICQYCGRKAPDVILQVDHKVSRMNGGSDEEANLITACSACNIGKNSESLGIPITDMKPNLKKYTNTTQQISNYLSIMANGATGTEIAKALGHNRANISRILNQSEQFVKTQKEGRNQFFSLKSFV